MDFFPRNPKFFEIFIELADLVASGGRLLTKIKIGSATTSAIATKMKHLEARADSLCHTLYREADSTFITPIDREDIHILAKTLDNIIDLVEDLAANIKLYKVTRGTHDFNTFAAIIMEAAAKIATLIRLLKGRDKHTKEMRKLIIAIHALENKGDEMMREAIKDLFADHKNPVTIIKWKDLYETMEKVLDECEDAADVVEQIIIKNF